MDIPIGDLEKACLKTTKPIRTGLLRENKSKKTGMGNKKCLPLKSVTKKGVGLPVMAGSPLTRAKHQ